MSMPLCPGSSKRTVPQTDELKSTWEHRYITAGTIALISLLFGKGVSEVHSLEDFCSSLGAVGFAYYLSGETTSLSESSRIFLQMIPQASVYCNLPDTSAAISFQLAARFQDL